MATTNTSLTSSRDNQVLRGELAEGRRTVLRLRVPIALSGMAGSGDSFSESTATELVSAKGAVVDSSYDLFPQQEIMLRYGSKQILGRVVGQTGLTERGHSYGITFMQADQLFWGVSFAHASTSNDPVYLECIGCSHVYGENINEIEVLVLNANRQLLLPCLICNRATIRKFAEGRVPISAGEVAVESYSLDGKVPEADSEDYEQDPNLVSVASLQNDELFRPPERAERRRSKRLNLKKAKACIERPGTDPGLADVVNVSRGGACVRSERQYALGDWIRIACPYTIGGANIFQPARIVRVAPNESYCEYGIEYVPMM